MTNLDDFLDNNVAVTVALAPVQRRNKTTHPLMIINYDVSKKSNEGDKNRSIK